MSQPPYARIVAEIRERIASGELGAGDRVPSTRQITQEWGVAMATATKVLAALRQEGLVSSQPGVGTVVRVPAVPEAAGLRRRPVRETGLSRERIVQAALGIADAEGMAGLTMRRVATELGVATMALYRYVRGREELVVLMAEAVFAANPPPPPLPGWRAQLVAIARLQWSVYRRHPWLPHVLSMTRPQVMPNGMAHTEWILRVIAGTGLDPNATVHASIGLVSFIRGLAVSLEPEVQARQDTGLTDEEWMQTQEPAMVDALATGRYPTFGRLLGVPGLDLDLDSLFEFTLGQLLDGLAARIQGPTSAPSSAGG